MKRYVALLRGINVGGNKTVAMAELKGVFEALGFESVSTYINSGNVIFESTAKDARKLAANIEKALAKAFGFEIRTVVRDSKNIAELCKKIPASWSNDAEQKTDVLFLWERFDDEDTIGLIKASPGVDTLKYISGAIAWNVKRKGYARSGMRYFIGTEVYRHMTARNVNTVRKLGEILAG